MKAIIIAAGIGSRLGDLTKDLPKPLIDVNGKSIIERQINSYRKHGINEIIIITGYQNQKFNLKNVKYVYNPDYAQVEQALKLTEKWNLGIFDGSGTISLQDEFLYNKIVRWRESNETK